MLLVDEDALLAGGGDREVKEAGEALRLVSPRFCARDFRRPEGLGEEDREMELLFVGLK